MKSNDQKPKMPVWYKILIFVVGVITLTTYFMFIYPMTGVGGLGLVYMLGYFSPLLALVIIGGVIYRDRH